MIIKRLLSLLSLSLFVTGAQAAPDSTGHRSVNYVPTLGGVVRGRFEQTTNDGGKGRFAVRNARLSVRGQVLPDFGYFILTDFCDMGKIKILDAYARFAPESLHGHLKVDMGQSRMPFSVDASRVPGLYYFANRSFIGKTVGNLRGVGVRVSYSFSGLPLDLEAGMFNSATIGDHTPWQTEYCYAGKARYTFIPTGLFAEAGFESTYPGGIRINNTDFCLQWHDAHWLLEAEYMYKHYTGDAAPACHGYNFMADWHTPVRWNMFNTFSSQIRWDGMTCHSDGKTVDEATAKLTCTDPARNRLTAGVTVSRIMSKYRADIRLNYEQYFLHHDTAVTPDCANKLCVELSLNF
ncbi:MAG: hypothetical protein K2M79_04020 [Muribaculaceae bacterium]|nr:hypothetical protein [Muribaculaceae bacterium]